MRLTPTRRAIVRALVLAATALGALILAGCGIRSATPPTAVQLTITRDFGAATITELPLPQIGRSLTVLALLQRNAAVQTSNRGYVQNIDGFGTSGVAGRALGWFYYVNGIELAQPPSRTALNQDDSIWWDRHAADITVRAVVGAFPEPFLHGSNGRRLPVVVECSDPAAPACGTVAAMLTRIGIPVARGGLLLAAGSEVLRVLVGSWSALRNDRAAVQIEAGPQTSGVFARIDPRGSALTVLNQRGEAVRTLGPGTGLIAATRYRNDEPIWVVTGTNSSGVLAAARAFDAGALHDRFALAVADGVGISLPQRAIG